MIGEKVEPSFYLLKEKGFIKEVSDNIFYRKIVNPKEKTITYTLPIHFYTPQKPYHLIQQIVVDKDNRSRVQYLKVTPPSSDFDKKDIFRDKNNKIEILDEKLENKYPNSSEGRKDKEAKTSGLKEMSRNCRIEINVYEIRCSNGGGHRIGESCDPGYVNDAHYEIETIERCTSDVKIPTGGAAEIGGSVNSGGTFVDYQLNKLVESPYFHYADFLKNDRYSLFLQQMRSWMNSNSMDNPNNIKLLNDKIGYLVKYSSLFDELETYNRRTPTVANQELTNYSIRVAQMFSHFLKNGTEHDAKVMGYSIRYLDQNRFISWEEYLPVYQGLSRVMALYPEISWDDMEYLMGLSNIREINQLDKLIKYWLNPNTVKPTVDFLAHAKLSKIYEQAKGTDRFKKFLKKFEPEFSVAHLMFDVGETLKTPFTETKTPKNYWIKIVFNKDQKWEDIPNVVVSHIFIHEIIHAEIYRQLLSMASTNGQIDKNKLENIFKKGKHSELFNYYVEKDGKTDNGQHHLMAEKYVDTIIGFLKEIYGNAYTDLEYESIAWRELMDSKAWNNLTEQEKELYKKTYKTNYWLWEK